MPDRNGKRNTREQMAKQRVPELGYYYIVTDANETEQNYLRGLRDSIPKEYQGKLVIKVGQVKTVELVDEAYEFAALSPQYREPWIVFDRDQVMNFDEIIESAKSKGVRAGWSNPCVEVWLGAYFGEMPTFLNSTKCCNGFSEKYARITGQPYKKSDPDIYDKLNRFGDEQNAIHIAELKIIQHQRDCKHKPSQMQPCTTLHELVKEIRRKIERIK